LPADERGARATSLFRAFVATRSDASFRALYDVATPAMFGFALRLAGGDHATAEDVVQDAWIRAINRSAAFSNDGSAVRWLNGFVVNCWRERRRSMMREEFSDALEQHADASSHVWSELPVLERAVNALPDGFRTVLVMHDVEGYTHQEIAQHLGLDEGTSKSQLTRARRRLRALMSAGRRNA
jgi:RNA polymerase sigma-70 factor (ECF subfamily)